MRRRSLIIALLLSFFVGGLAGAAVGDCADGWCQYLPFTRVAGAAAPSCGEWRHYHDSASGDVFWLARSNPTAADANLVCVQLSSNFSTDPVNPSRLYAVLHLPDGDRQTELVPLREGTPVFSVPIDAGIAPPGAFVAVDVYLKNASRDSFVGTTFFFVQAEAS